MSTLYDTRVVIEFRVLSPTELSDEDAYGVAESMLQGLSDDWFTDSNDPDEPVIAQAWFQTNEANWKGIPTR